MLIKWICNDNKMIPIKDLNYFDVERVKDDEFNGFKFNIEYITAERKALFYCDINTIRAYAKKENLDVSFIKNEQDAENLIDGAFKEFEKKLIDFMIDSNITFDYYEVLNSSIRASISNYSEKCSF